MITYVFLYVYMYIYIYTYISYIHNIHEYANAPKRYHSDSSTVAKVEHLPDVQQALPHPRSVLQSPHPGMDSEVEGCFFFPHKKLTHV